MKDYTTNKRYYPHEISTKLILYKHIVKQKIFHTFAESIRYQKPL